MSKHNRKRIQRDQSPDTPLRPVETPLDQKQRELEGDRPVEDQDLFIDQSDVDHLGKLSPTGIYEGELEAGVDADLAHDEERLELLTELELRADETDDVIEAIQEGLTYVPPIDPPTVPSSDPLDSEIASGLGVSALDEPYDAEHHSDFLPDDDEMSARVREALRADSSTTGFTSRISVSTHGGVVTLRGIVDDLEDSDNAVAVASYVHGVVEVIDELEIATQLQ